MRYLKVFGSAALAAALMAFVVVGTASAAIIESGGGTQYKAGASITAESEGTTELHPPIGSINCKKSHVAIKTTNDGGAGVNVNGNVEGSTWQECNATVTVLAKGTLSIASSSGSNGSLSSTGYEATVVYLGFHCIFKTNNTSLGTVTGSSTTGGAATLDISATIPRTGGGSGAFCGTTAAWTGSYAVSTPSSLNIT